MRISITSPGVPPLAPSGGLPPACQHFLTRFCSWGAGVALWDPGSPLGVALEKTIMADVRHPRTLLLPAHLPPVSTNVPRCI
jgi:hypothetical protein